VRAVLAGLGEAEAAEVTHALRVQLADLDATVAVPPTARE